MSKDFAQATSDSAIDITIDQWLRCDQRRLFIRGRPAPWRLF